MKDWAEIYAEFMLEKRGTGNTIEINIEADTVKQVSPCFYSSTSQGQLC